MDLPPELRVIHEPVRLRILGLLYRQTDLGFTAIRDGLGLSAGNLATHAAKLQESGFVEAREALTRNGFEKRFQITALGLSAFEQYLAVLERFLAASRIVAVTPTGPAPVPPLSAALGPTAQGSAATPRSGKARSAAAFAVAGMGLLFVAVEAAQNILSDASGSDYLGIGAAGVLSAGVVPLERFLRRLAGAGLKR